MIEEIKKDFGIKVIMIAFALFAFYLGYQQCLNDIEQEQSEIKPCNCLTISEVLLHINKRERFIDELQRAKMGKRNALIDSINFHNTILDSTGNRIEY